MKKYSKVLCFDVDGTLVTCGGPITADLINAQRKDSIVGILSSRCVEDSKKVCDELGIEVDFIESCGINFNVREPKLNEIKRRYPLAKEYIYVGDREEDENEAIKAGWEFIYAV